MQDIVNELGRRLDFEVENGLYQGRRNAVGFDGIWRLRNETNIVVEVKTTDYVAISLNKLQLFHPVMHGPGIRVRRPVLMDCGEQTQP